jgi:hypothetical protein
VRKYVVLRYCAVTLLAPRAPSRSGSRPAASGWLLVWSPHAGWWPSWRWRLGLEHTAGRVKPIHPPSTACFGRLARVCFEGPKQGCVHAGSKVFVPLPFFSLYLFPAVGQHKEPSKGKKPDPTTQAIRGTLDACSQVGSLVRAPPFFQRSGLASYEGVPQREKGDQRR